MTKLAVASHANKLMTRMFIPCKWFSSLFTGNVLSCTTPLWMCLSMFRTMFSEAKGDRNVFFCYLWFNSLYILTRLYFQIHQFFKKPVKGRVRWKRKLRTFFHKYACVTGLGCSLWYSLWIMLTLRRQVTQFKQASKQKRTVGMWLKWWNPYRLNALANILFPEIIHTHAHTFTSCYLQKRTCTDNAVL